MEDSQSVFIMSEQRRDAFAELTMLRGIMLVVSPNANN